MEGVFAGSYSNLIKSKKMADSSSPNPTPVNPSFDCNICLDFVSDPVVTLCGHLYCWPCIYRWLHPTSSSSPRRCPVCKSPLTDSSLVPVYGRGLAAETHGKGIDIPGRPRDNRNLAAAASADQRPYHTRVLHSTAGVVLGEIACAVLPWAFTNPPGSHLSPAVGEAIVENPRWRRLEMRSEIWLHQLWVFLLCCALFCLLFF